MIQCGSYLGAAKIGMSVTVFCCFRRVLRLGGDFLPEERLDILHYSDLHSSHSHCTPFLGQFLRQQTFCTSQVSNRPSTPIDIASPFHHFGKNKKNYMKAVFYETFQDISFYAVLTVAISAAHSFNLLYFQPTATLTRTNIDYVAYFVIKLYYVSFVFIPF